MNKRAFVIAPTALVVLAACAGTTHSATVATAQSFADALCRAMEACCVAASSSVTADCSSRFPQSVADATVVYDAAAGQKCLDAIASQPSSYCTRPPAECATATVFQPKTGNRAPGDPCDTASDCAPSDDGAVVCGVQPDTGDDPICEVTIRGREGDPCAETREIDGHTSGAYGARLTQCWTADGLRCDHATSTCTKLHAIGGTCPTAWSLKCKDLAITTDPCGAGGRVCALGARCAVVPTPDDQAATTTRCVAAGKAGDQCEHDSDCLGGRCDRAHTCVVPVRAGGDCARDADCHADSRCFGGHCVAADGSSVVCPACVCGP